MLLLWKKSLDFFKIFRVFSNFFRFFSDLFIFLDIFRIFTFFKFFFGFLRIFSDFSDFSKFFFVVRGFYYFLNFSDFFRIIFLGVYEDFFEWTTPRSNLWNLTCCTDCWPWPMLCSDPWRTEGKGRSRVPWLPKRQRGTTGPVVQQWTRCCRHIEIVRLKCRPCYMGNEWSLFEYYLSRPEICKNRWNWAWWPPRVGNSRLMLLVFQLASRAF